MADFIIKILEKWIHCDIVILLYMSICKLLYFYIVNHKSKSSLNSLFGLLRLSTKPLILAWSF